MNTAVKIVDGNVVVVNASTGAIHINIPVSRFGGAINAMLNPDNTVVVMCIDGKTRVYSQSGTLEKTL